MTIAERVHQLLRDTEALLEGHFLLTSGLHSTYYVQCARLLQYPQHAEALGEWLAARFIDQAIDVVISPALGGVIIGHETARAFGVRAIFGERQAGAMTLRRGLSIRPGERVLVIEDVTTTGGSVREILQVVQACHGIAVGAGVILDRSGGQIDLGLPLQALVTQPMPTYAPETCVLCQQGSQAIKPGSRQLA
jgi:orotate phosphoribosyltransferase